MAEVSYDAPTGLPDATVLYLAAQRLVALPELSERQEAVQTLFRLVDGVLATPEEAKKRRVKKSNATFFQKAGRHPAAVDFLKGVGFVDADDPDVEGEEGKGALLMMPVAYLSRLTDAHHTLARFAQEAGLTAPPLPQSAGGFNPYISNRQATDTTQSTKAPDAWKSEADRVRDEVKKRQRELQEQVTKAPPVDMNPSAFWHASGRRLEAVIQEAETANPAEDRAADNALLQSQVASAKATIAGPAKFVSADKRRLEELSHKRVHQICVLRIVCPDKSVLQATFRAADTGERVVEQLAPLLDERVRATPWYLYQSPPLKRLGARETLLAAGFAPGASLYLGFEGTKPGPPYLAPTMLAQLGPPDDGPRGVNAPAGPTFSGEAMGWGVGKKLGGAPPAQSARTDAAAPAAPAPAPAEAGVMKADA